MKQTLSFLSELMIVTFSVTVVFIAGFAGIVSWPKNETVSGYFFVGENPYGAAIFQKKAHASVQFNGFTTGIIRNNIISLRPDDKKAKTIIYNRDDIIFDDKGVLYTQPKSEQILAVEEQITSPLVKYADDSREIVIQAQTLYIVNPHIPGALEIKNLATSPVRLNRDSLTLTLTKIDSNVIAITHNSLTKLSAMKIQSTSIEHL